MAGKIKKAKSISFSDAFRRLQKKLRSDKGYRLSWIANIAMAYIDCERWYREKTGKKSLSKTDKHKIANDAAEYFLKQLCDQSKAPKGR